MVLRDDRAAGAGGQFGHQGALDVVADAQGVTVGEEPVAAGGVGAPEVPPMFVQRVVMGASSVQP
jgi:hypothetical protein